MEKRWRYLNPDPRAVRELALSLPCSPVTAAVLVNRNISAPETARTFLNPSLQRMRPPFDMQDMHAAVDRIDRALRGREKILVFGDYDVDGVTATAILFDFLLAAGAAVDYYIPHRRLEGYGLRSQHIQRIAVPKGVDLILTADCGSGSHAAIRAARRAGIDVIVTDHHNVSNPFPEAVALVNPKRPDCDAGFEHLAGAGVALALIISLRKRLRETGHWKNRPEPNLKQLCDLVALGTVADAVPLIEENRLFCRAGLDRIRSGDNRIGVQALLTACGIGHQGIDAEDIAFKLAPRLNAAGRMAHARLAVELLRTARPQKAARIAMRLNRLNAGRKQAESLILDEIDRYLTDRPAELDRKSLVLARRDWHEGVLGIVAARLTERFARPVVLISLDGDTGKGSGRSIPGFDLFGGLAACGDRLEQYGGHAMAAGLRIHIDQIDAFREAFDRCVQTAATDPDFVPEIQIETRIDFESINDRLMDEIAALGPFGQTHADPLFAAGDVAVREAQIVGEYHRRMLLQQTARGSKRTLPAIQFQIDPRRPFPKRFREMAFRLQWNHWNGRRRLQAVVEDFKAAK
jgi:single-stranded-DNA-specific exonuclease